MNKLWRKVKRVVGVDPNYYDMFDHRGESFYAQIYLSHIFSHLEEVFGEKSLEICDAGCQAGRLAIPLAKAGHHVTGIDTSSFALARAKKHAQENGLDIKFLRGDMAEIIGSMKQASWDSILALEALYLTENFREILTVFRKAMKSPGLVFISHRPPHYYVAKAIQARDFDTVRFILNHQEGKLWGSYFNWQTQKEIETLYEDLGFSIKACYPIGVFSGTGGERASGEIDPAVLDGQTLDLLQQLEIEASFQQDWKALGRYTLVVASLKL